MKWISVKDRLPEKDGRYLVCYANLSDVVEAIYNSSFGFIHKCTANTFQTATHWMPLPEPPKDSQSK